MARQATARKAAAPAGAAAAPPVSDDIQRVAVVRDPSPTAGIVGATSALSPGQLAGLDPIDPELDAEQAEDRENRTNRQTDHEAENALDPVSGGPSPGVTSQAPLTAKAAGSPVTDMSGRPALDVSDKEALPRMQQALKDGRAKDKENRRLKPERVGWRTPADMGIPGAVVRRIFDAYPDKMEVEEVPNGHHFPETGRRYRLK